MQVCAGVGGKARTSSKEEENAGKGLRFAVDIGDDNCEGQGRRKIRWGGDVRVFSESGRAH